MGKLNRAIREIRTIDYMASRNQWLNNIHPLVKLCLTVMYICLVVSFDKYDIFGIASMAVYPVMVFELGDVSFRDALYRLRIVLPLVCLVGIFNPFFDKEVIAVLGGVAISGGVVSMLTLMLKGIFTVLASYLLIATTTMEKLCYAMRLVKLPRIFVTEMMLIYRYITLLLSEAHKMTQAYALRAPGQKGIAFKVWGTLAGQLLLRSIDRADSVYEAMNLRGYCGEYYMGEKMGFGRNDALHLAVWVIVLPVLRFLPVLTMLGNMFM